MQTYHLELKADVSKTFHAVRAAQSLDIDVEKKSVHKFEVQADFETPFSIGLIVGASGSGKTTLAKHVFGDDCFRTYLDKSRAVIDQFPEEMKYDERASILNGIGLSSVPCWIKPAGTLSNGQQARAEAALALAHGDSTIVIDEWTSVVDRTVAKAMSLCVSKFAKRGTKKLILVSCHYDVIEWLDPDWVVDCNSQRFTDRRLLQRGRTERLSFDICEITGRSWARFSKYHYLSEELPGGKRFFYGLFHGQEQIGFQCFANYVPRKNPADSLILHSNRTVVHPDYVGMGLGLKMVNQTAQILHEQGYRIMAKFSSEPMYRARLKSPYWRLRKVDRPIGRNVSFIRTCTLERKDEIRTNLKIYSFEFLGL